jgi:hypothetical protein
MIIQVSAGVLRAKGDWEGLGCDCRGVDNDIWKGEGH